MATETDLTGSSTPSLDIVGINLGRACSLRAVRLNTCSHQGPACNDTAVQLCSQFDGLAVEVVDASRTLSAACNVSSMSSVADSPTQTRVSCQPRYGHLGRRAVLASLPTHVTLCYRCSVRRIFEVGFISITVGTQSSPWFSFSTTDFVSAPFINSTSMSPLSCPNVGCTVRLTGRQLLHCEIVVVNALGIIVAQRISSTAASLSVRMGISYGT